MDAYSPPTTNISISSLSTIFEQILCCTKIGQLFNIPIFRMFQTLVGAMQKFWNNSESRSLSSGLKWNFWSVWNFQICNIDMKNFENTVAVMWNLWISAKMLLFPPTNFTYYWSLDGQYSRLSHRFYTYPTPIKQNCLIGTTILDTIIVYESFSLSNNCHNFHLSDWISSKRLVFTPNGTVWGWL